MSEEKYYIDMYTDCIGWVLFTVKSSANEVVDLIERLPDSLVGKLRVRTR